MFWLTPKRIKVFEALGVIADNRLEISKDGTEGKCFSSSGNKFYSIKFDEEKNAIMCNDNASFFVETLGYPAIAFLMLRGRIIYSKTACEALKAVPWKDFNVKNKNDFDETEKDVLKILEEKGFDVKELVKEIDFIYAQVKELKILLLGEKTKPPIGY